MGRDKLKSSKKAKTKKAEKDKTYIKAGLLLGVRYVVREDVLGGGGFGKVLSVLDLCNKDLPLAIKIHLNQSAHKEPPMKDCHYPTNCPGSIRTDYYVMKNVDGKPGFPKAYDLGRYGTEYYLIMDKLGDNLLNIFWERQQSFSMKALLLLTDQLLERIQVLHEHGIIHGDIKPDNMCMGLGANSHIVHLIDFGLSRMYVDSATMEHFPLVEERYVGGTYRFMSLNNHQKMRPSRRDDLESLAYVLAFFVLHEKLPWRPWDNHRVGDLGKVMQIKEKIRGTELFWGQPREFAVFFEIVKKLEYAERPPYEEFRNMFRLLGACIGVDYKKDKLNFS